MDRDHQLAELAALEDGADEARIVADTHRAYAAEIAATKEWIYTDLRSDARRLADGPD